LLLRTHTLAAGLPEIHIFGDGSFQQLLGTGTWAFSVPAFALQQVGLEAGPSVEHFEIRAALSAIHTVLELDQTRRPLRVFTDSEIALNFLQHAAKRDLLPPRKSFHRVRVLYDLAVALAAQRRVVPVKVRPKRAEHVDATAAQPKGCATNSRQTRRSRGSWLFEEKKTAGRRSSKSAPHCI